MLGTKTVIDTHKNGGDPGVAEQYTIDKCVIIINDRFEALNVSDPAVIKDYIRKFLNDTEGIDSISLTVLSGYLMEIDQTINTHVILHRVSDAFSKLATVSSGLATVVSYAVGEGNIAYGFKCAAGACSLVSVTAGAIRPMGILNGHFKVILI